METFLIFSISSYVKSQLQNLFETSLTKQNICILLVISILAGLLYFYINKKNPELEEFFIPERPSMNEYYIHKIRDCPKRINPNIRFFMALPYGDSIVSKNNLWIILWNLNKNFKIFKVKFYHK